MFFQLTHCLPDNNNNKSYDSEDSDIMQGDHIVQIILHLEQSALISPSDRCPTIILIRGAVMKMREDRISIYDSLPLSSDL